MGVLLMVVLAGCESEGSDTTVGSSTSAPPKTLPNESEAVAVESGTYRVVPEPSSSVLDYTVTLPDGWAVQYAIRFSKGADTDGQVGFYATSVQGIFADSCAGTEGDVVEVGPGVDDLATALLAQSGPQASEPVDTTLGGYPATRIDLTVPASVDEDACNLPDGQQQLWFAEPADPEGYTVLFPDTTASVYIVDVEGERQVFYTVQWAGASDEDRQELQAALDSIRFEA